MEDYPETIMATERRTPRKVIPKSVAALGLLCSLALSAVCFVFSENQACHNADSLMPVIISTQLWTPFFWGTNRYGMLLPLIAGPLTNPLTNLAFQNVLCVILCLALPMLIARFLLRTPLWPAIGALVSAFFVGLLSPCFVFLQFTSQCYYPALALCLSGLLLFCSRSVRPQPKDTVLSSGGVILVLLSFWIAPTLLLTVLPMVVVLGWAPQVPSTIGGSIRLETGVMARLRGFALKLFSGISNQCWRTVVLLLVAFAFSLFLAKLSVYQTGYHFLSPTQWPAGWLTLMRNFVAEFLPNPTVRMVFVGVAVIGFVIWRLRRHTPEGREISVAFLAVLAAICSEWFVAGANAWVRANGYAGRYMSTSFMLVVVVCAAVPPAGLALPKITRYRHLINALALAILILVPTIRFGLPSVVTMREALDLVCGKYSSDIVESGCTHFAGNYWKVWPSVFHANLLLREKAIGRTVWGMSYRCENSRIMWPTERGSAYLIGMATDDEEGQWAMIKQGIDASRVGKFGAIDLFRCEAPCSMYTRPYHFGTRDLHSRIGAVDKSPNVLAECSKGQGREGLMIAGPYIFLEKGRYLFEISGMATDVDLRARRCAKVRINRLGYRAVIEKEITKEDLVGGNYDIALEFLVDKDGPNWEFQVYYWPVSNFSVSRISLLRVGY